MSSNKEIRNKIVSIKQTRKITNAMQMISAGKRRKAEARMKSSMSYAEKVSQVIEHIKQSSSEYASHSYLTKHEKIDRIGILVISTDRGLCGGLNINLFRKVILELQEWQNQGVKTELFLIGNKATAFFKNVQVHMKTQIAGLGEHPTISDLIGTVKIMRDAYDNFEIDSLFIAYNEFVNTMIQRPKIEQLLPLMEIGSSRTASTRKGGWDYIYEPNSILVLQNLLIRYIETKIYQAVVDGIACEHASRMIAMKGATDSATKLIDEMEFIFNKKRQAAITQEIAEIVSGASDI